jgi:Excalibur calcium-binding domain
MRLRSTAVAAVLAAGLSLPMIGTANAADRDCPDFASQAEAQAAFAAVPGDPERLDGDDDGVACEDYAYPAASTSTSTASTGGQVATVPAGAVAAGDGSSAQGGSALPYVLGGLAFAGAGGAAVAARRSSRSAA